MYLKSSRQKITTVCTVISEVSDLLMRSPAAQDAPHPDGKPVWVSGDELNGILGKMACQVGNFPGIDWTLAIS